jgi:hypothetical protein
MFGLQPSPELTIIMFSTFLVVLALIFLPGERAASKAEKEVREKRPAAE